MTDTQTLDTLREYRDRFTREIFRQAEQVVARHCAVRRLALLEALRGFGLEPSVTVRVVDIWEDYEHGQLPPKIIAELRVVCHTGTLTQRFDVPIGAFHDNAKDDQVFELCMLRAEANQELDGIIGDGHVLDRMSELEGMIAEGKVLFES
ncbi:MAG: hypothetical protein ACYDBB_07875 [Armatimonadota bacterium]